MHPCHYAGSKNVAATLSPTSPTGLSVVPCLPMGSRHASMQKQACQCTKASLKRAMVGKVERAWSDGASALTVVGMVALVDIVWDCLQHTTGSRPDMGVVAQRLCNILG